MDNPLKIKIYAFTLDCINPSELADFYAALLNWDKVVKDDDWAWVVAPEKYPYILFQRNLDYEPPVWPEEPNRQQQMAHIDFAVNDLDKAVQHALSCGAKMASEQFSDNWKVMFDPAGHPFCLCLKKTIFI